MIKDISKKIKMLDGSIVTVGLFIDTRDLDSQNSLVYVDLYDDCMMTWRTNDIELSQLTYGIVNDGISIDILKRMQFEFDN